jgi:uncharacterized protein (TIGR04255 family)
MVAKGTPLPDRIEPDAIIEALFEMRFDMVSPLPEVLFGRLAELDPWRGFNQRKLPAYDIPSAFRDADPTLRFVPVFELSSTNPPRAVRIGAHVLSYHHLPPYAGWAAFSTELDTAIDGLFDRTQGLAISRLGLRYINALSPDLHGIATVSDMDLELKVSGVPVGEKVNLNFITDTTTQAQCTVRVASRDFVQGQFSPEAKVLVDIDVFTTSDFRADSKAVIKQWAANARTTKNEAFFGLLRQMTIERLRR